MKITTSGISGLIGDRYISPEFEVDNTTDGPLVLNTAELVVEGAARYLGDLPNDGALEWRTVAPGERRRIGVSWEFEERPMEVLGPNPTLVLTFSLGEEEHRREIIYERVE